MANEITYHADPNVIKYISDKVHDDFYYLGIGKEIPLSADLNSYITPGVYYRPGGSVPCLNAPDELSDMFTLIVREVEDVSGSPLVTQEIQNRGLSANNAQNGGFIRFIRNYHSSRTENKFSEWICISGVDSILAEGTTNGWSWIKYANGLAIMAKAEARNLTSSEVSAVYGNNYRSMLTYSFPFPLISGKSGAVTVSGHCTTDSTLLSVNGTNKDGNSCYVIPMFNSGGAKTVAFNIIAIGWWK